MTVKATKVDILSVSRCSHKEHTTPSPVKSFRSRSLLSVLSLIWSQLLHGPSMASGLSNFWQQFRILRKKNLQWNRVRGKLTKYKTLHNSNHNNSFTQRSTIIYSLNLIIHPILLGENNCRSSFKQLKELTFLILVLLSWKTRTSWNLHIFGVWNHGWCQKWVRNTIQTDCGTYSFNKI